MPPKPKKPSVYKAPLEPTKGSKPLLKTEERGQKNKEGASLLSKNWKNKNKLQQAFILAEVLKRFDERSF